MQSFSNKITLITGAASGIGRLLAAKISARGGRVVLWDIDEERLSRVADEISSSGNRVRAYGCDVSNREMVYHTAGKVRDELGKVDILINNAAIYDGLKRKPFYEIDPNEWDLVMRVNVKGAFLCTRAVFPHMRNQGYGKIVNLASEVFFTGSHGFAHYVASKGGIIGLTRALAIELGPHGVRINCVAPGFTDTEASRGIADVAKYDTSRTPLGRVVKPEDLTGAVIFLASSESDFITGQAWLVDGGRVMH
jgi:3-oxoacyl-[acyl-carrier protein] reductase